MVVLNYTGGEINAKIVYYGPGVSGKTTNLEYIHEKAPDSAKGKMVSMKTQTDRTLFFDFLPLELGDINGYRTRFLLYTVPGQVYYNATRKLVLKGVDAVVFVADSSRAKLDENLESLRNLEQNLNEHGLSLDDVPWVIQYNKRDIADAMPVAELDARLNPLGVPTFEAVAIKGTGVYDTLHGISTKVYGVLKERLDREEAAGAAAPAPAPPVAAKPAPTPAKPAPKAAPAPRRAAAPVLAAATAPQSAMPAGHGDVEIEHEHDVDHAVDFALRESDAKAGQLPPRAPERPAPLPAAAPAAAPAANRAGETDDLFEAIPESGFDVELGRLPSLDEASAASDTAREEGPEEFVTDPMRHAVRRAAAPAPAPAPARMTPPAPLKDVHLDSAPAPVKNVRLEPAPAPVKNVRLEPAAAPAPVENLHSEPAPAAPTAAPAAPRVPKDIPVVEELHVPVSVTREQLERASSLRIVIDLEIERE